MADKILIADSGSSKTDWCLVDKQQLILEVETLGLNPDFHDYQSLLSEISKVQEALEGQNWSQLFFYGSGVSSESRKEPLLQVLNEVFPKQKHFVEHDLIGAARATRGDEPGLVGILGTGSNCCSYTGELIDQEYRSGGYILSDEGGGVYLGKMILKAFIEEMLADELMEDFQKEYSLNVDQILHAMYKEPLPNRFIAAFSRFAKKHEDHPQIKAMIQNSFDDFFRLKVCRFTDYKSKSLGIVGSIAQHFQVQIKEAAIRHGVQLSIIEGRPIEALCRYHQAKLE